MHDKVSLTINSVPVYSFAGYVMSDIKKNVAVVFGGTSVEHEISVISAASVIRNIDRNKFDILPVYIDREGVWRLVSEEVTGAKDPVVKAETRLVPSLGSNNNPSFFELEGEKVIKTHYIDVVFPVLHGTYGEDGTVQGMLELMFVPYVGSSVLGSSLSMDKIVMKSVLRDHGLPVVSFVSFSRDEWESGSDSILGRISEEIGFPCFVKAADLGSSIGITKVAEFDGLADAVTFSLRFSNRVLVEVAVNNPREIEVSVLGDEEPVASKPGEIIPKREFYDYEAKYHDDTTELKIPAEISRELSGKLGTMAVETFKALCCSGMGRVDYLLDNSSGDVFISEINTIPGFTSISMYPKLWEISGVGYTELLTRLIELAFAKSEKKKNLNTSLGI